MTDGSREESTSSRSTDVVYSPWQLGPVRLRNRLVMAPMVTLFPEVTDRPTQCHVDFYSRRARGGAGLVIVGATYVVPEGKGFPNQMGIDEDDKTAAFRQLASRIQRHAPSILQLFHAGSKTARSVSGHDVVGLSASGPCEPRYSAPRALTGHEVERLIADFEAAARRASDAGFCGVELHGANGYLLHAFSDPLSNRRADRWGRLDAFPTALVRRLRGQLPPRFLIGYTLSPFSISARDVADTASVERFTDLAAKLAESGVDYVHVYRGKSEHGEQGPRVFTEILRDKELRLPVIEGAGIRSAAQAGVFLRRGATLAAVGRALVGQADLLAVPGIEYPAADLARLSTSEGLRNAFVAEYCRRADDGQAQEDGSMSSMPASHARQ